MPRFGDWLERTRVLQEEAFGIPVDDLLFDEWQSYVRGCLWAAFVELGEVSQELPLKFWKDYEEQDLEDALQRKAPVDELVDVLHFVANVLVALGVTDAELDMHYDRGEDKNRKRQEARNGTQE